ncbi:ThuA domain-containing protein [Mucilaginibacter sp.]|uniref:ThuA domain-containing protein n=1 Tax=Mucilaginibacter sp. TaxID=1882438 RepID=UPI00283AE2AE|nr:ThuA domain-containing protein [Mucilaginibacter sp.]MDR3697053.1 ThuA domain-containing protein [Mucilaginibacter sp.]
MSSPFTLKIRIVTLLTFHLICLWFSSADAQNDKRKFKVIAFYTAKDDKAHISFVHEANAWFPLMAAKYHFQYDSTKNWDNMNPGFLSHYQVVVFLDTRPDKPSQREAFQKYMEKGGGWMGFHFSAFALTPSDFNQDWDWYHETFLGSGQYVSNIWRPSAAILDVDRNFPATKHMPKTFKTSPNEWYRWEHDLRKNPDIQILCYIDSASFPLGTGPKLSEIWHSGYYPVVWTNKKYKMIYFNMGHNDMDYEHKYDNTDKTLSNTFSSPMEAKLVVDALLWLGNRKK